MRVDSRKIGQEPPLTFRRAFFWILLSTALISGTAGILTLYYFHVKEIQLQDPNFNIAAIAQTGKEKGRLTTSYLAELLGLAVNNPVNLNSFKTDQAVIRLLTSPWISAAEVSKIRPDTLAVAYTLRKPLFRLADFENGAIDADGMIFPLSGIPVETVKTDVYFGNLDESYSWGSKVNTERVRLAIDILHEANKRDIPLSLIDLSKVEAQSFGERQVVLVLEEPREWILRLRVGDFSSQLDQVLLLFKNLNDNNEESNGKIIDLRVPQLAFMQEL